MYSQPIEQPSGDSASQNGQMTDASIGSMAENGTAAADAVHCTETDEANGKAEPISIDDQSNKAPESALEQLANQPEAISKYTDMTNDVKEMDMIAFKVFTPNFEQSDYVIGLVEAIVGRTSPNQQDYDLVLQIMGTKFFFFFFVSFVVTISHILLMSFIFQPDTITSNT